MQLLITAIQWDTDGEELDECALPETVVMLDAPGNPDEDTISETLSDAFGFCHGGFQWERLSPVQDTHAGGGYYPKRLGLCRYPN